jgi:hypothetical protein
MASRRERNLCYNCDETFTPQHRCKGKFFLLVSDHDLDVSLLPEDLPSPDSDADNARTLATDAQLSLHAMSGSFTTNTFRILGTIAKKPVTVLVDSGSTHNFIQHRVARFLGLSVTPASRPLKVMVGNGEVLECSTHCSNVTISLQGHDFTADFFLLPLSGAEVVLGVPWLVSLGPIMTDYTTMQMRFEYLGRPIELRADAPFKPKDISVPQVKRCVATHSASVFLHLQMVPDPPATTTPIPPPIQTLLTRFQTLFNPSPSLPPQRTYDHHIHLHPNASPVNVRPYR